VAFLSDIVGLNLANAGIRHRFLQPFFRRPALESTEHGDSSILFGKVSYFETRKRLKFMAMQIGNHVRLRIPASNFFFDVFDFSIVRGIEKLCLAFNKNAFVTGCEFATVNPSLGIKKVNTKDSLHLVPDSLAPVIGLLDFQNFNSHVSIPDLPEIRWLNRTFNDWIRFPNILWRCIAKARMDSIGFAVAIKG
jgi:hypothetical protein